jgi:hypothetical protein
LLVSVSPRHDVESIGHDRVAARDVYGDEGMHRYSPAVEVTHVSHNGFWLLLHAEAILVRFDDFPLFRDASAEALMDVHWPQPERLYWPKIGIELPLAMIRPEVDQQLMATEQPLPS